MAPTSTATSGNTSWMLNTNGTRHRRANSQPGIPRISGGLMASTASGRNCGRIPAARLNPVNPPNATARAGMLLLSVGNGWSRVIHPNSVASVRDHEPFQPSSTRWCLYHGRAVITCNRWPRAASSSTMFVITSPVGATSGA